VVGGDDPGALLGIEGQAALDELSAISGGRAYLPKNIEEIKQVFDLVGQELRRQYMIGFRPPKDTADGKWHKIKVKVKAPLTAKGRKQTIYVRNRESYFAVKGLR
jgi:Ca-activated chloride channel family protein